MVVHFIIHSLQCDYMLLKSNSVSFESTTNDGLLKGNIGVKSAPFRLASYCVCSKLTTKVGGILE